MRFNFIDVPGRVKLPASSFFSSISFLLMRYSFISDEEKLKRLSHHFFAFLPERLSGFNIDCISTHSFADGSDGRIVRHDIANVAVLAISPTDFVSRGNYGSPHRRCSSLGNGLPLKGPLPLRGELLINLSDYLFQPSGLHVSAQLCLYAPRMHRRRANAPVPVTFVECDREEDVRRFGSAISDERLIGRAIKVRIFQIYV